MTEKKELSEKKETLPVDVSMFEADAGGGLEGADAESFAIPFLMILQKGSAQVDETHSNYIEVEGAKPGVIYDNVSQACFSGKEGVEFIPCSYRRVFVRWGSDASGEGFKGEYLPEEAARLRDKGEVEAIGSRLYFKSADGTVNEKKSDLLSDTRNHYILFKTEDGDWQRALFSLSSTQIKKSKMLITSLANKKVTQGDKRFTPSTYANIVRLTTVPESNDKGSWYGVRFKLEGLVPNQDLYRAAKEFAKQVREGGVESRYEADSESEDEGF